MSEREDGPTFADLWRALDGLGWSLGVYRPEEPLLDGLSEGDCYLVISFGQMPEALARAKPYLDALVSVSPAPTDAGGRDV